MNKNVVLFLTGFCMYITVEVLFRGYSFWEMGVVAGCAFLLLDKLNDYISWNMDLLLQSLIGSIFITLSELIVGTLALHGIFPIMWDYSNMPLNYNGVICLPFSLIWMVLSCIVIFIDDAINYYVYEEIPVPYYRIFGKVVLTFKEKQCKL